MRVVTYRITLLEPTLVATLDGDPNSAVSFDYLPGSVLRGAVIGKYLRENKLTPAQFDAATADVRRLFFDGTTRYLNGYPLERNKRALPTPESWQQDKQEVAKQKSENGMFAPAFDFAITPRDHEEKQWKSVGKPFNVLDDDGARFVQPDRLIAIHTARDRIYGRARTDSGAIYRYESLKEGQTFETAVLCDYDPDTATLLPLLQGEATLGGSRNGGYGRASFEGAKEVPTWRETGGTLQAGVAGKLIVTLLSDALMRDGNGQFVVDPAIVTATLSAALGGVSLALRKGETFLRGTTIGGFNRKWGLPLPQALAVKMGSVFVYDALACDLSKLRELEARGIGERRAEGFGRVAVNWQAEDELAVKPLYANRPAALQITDAASRDIAQRMAERMLRRKLDAALMQRANALGKQIKQPKNSQLSRLRLIIQDALRRPSANRRNELIQYFAGLESRQTTRKQFTHDRVAGKGLLEWLRFRVNDETDIWQEVGIDSNNLPKVGANVSASLNGLAYEYNLRLIDGVLARAAKERRGED
jgi:CRISPR-associated protein Csx10